MNGEWVQDAPLEWHFHYGEGCWCEPRKSFEEQVKDLVGNLDMVVQDGEVTVEWRK